MTYDSTDYSLKDLLRPVVAAEDALARLDERVARKGDFGELGSRQSKDGLLRENEGWIARSHFMEACNSLWLSGNLFMSKTSCCMMPGWTSVPQRTN